MNIRIYDSLTKQYEELDIENEKLIRMYVCGATTYDYCHLGHARIWVFFDVIQKYLESTGHKVQFISNITDIDDKIINRAKQEGKTYQEISNLYIDAMRKDRKKLHCTDPEEEPKVTDNIKEILDAINNMVSNGYAYITEKCNIYFDTSRSRYDWFRNRTEVNIENRRIVQHDNEKKNIDDFVLWKAFDRTEDGFDPKEKQYGGFENIPYGRPGWHTECVVMSTSRLGESFEIHGGGSDLQFPHHHNEIAQAKALGYSFAKTWMHVGMVNIKGDKMSKSTGNMLYIKDLLEKYHSEVIRYFLLSAHYRSQLEYSESTIQQCENSLRKLYRSILDNTTLPPFHERGGVCTDMGVCKERISKFNNAMNDDFNIIEAMPILFRVSSEIESCIDVQKKKQLCDTMIHIGHTLGILQCDPKEFLGISDSSIEELIEKRNIARKEKRWVDADRIREEIREIGYELEDMKDGQTRCIKIRK